MQFWSLLWMYLELLSMWNYWSEIEINVSANFTFCLKICHSFNTSNNEMSGFCHSPLEMYNGLKLKVNVRCDKTQHQVEYGLQVTDLMCIHSLHQSVKRHKTIHTSNTVKDSYFCFWVYIDVAWLFSSPDKTSSEVVWLPSWLSTYLS